MFENIHIYFVWSNFCDGQIKIQKIYEMKLMYLVVLNTSVKTWIPFMV